MAFRLGSATAALLGIAALSAVLAVESADTSRRHEITARAVLTDYAAIGAEGVAIRLQSQLAGRFTAILNSLAASVHATREQLVLGLGPGAANIAQSATWIGRFEKNGSVTIVTFDSTVSPPSDIGQDVHAAAVKLPESAYFGTIVVHDTWIVFNRLQKDVATGFFAIPLSGLNATLQRIVDNDAVIPAAITHGKSIDSGLVVEVALAGVRLAHRGAAKSAQFHSKHAVGTAFGDMTVAVGLSEALAPDLVIGGLPGSRLPFLIGIVVLSLLLLVIALVQLHQREKLARLREDFVAGTSHELRTPLAQIRLFAETLRLERVRSDSERNHALIVIEREARRLEHLVENLLHFSRAERGTLQIATEALNLAALTREIVSEFLPLALKADVTVVVDAPSVVSANVDAGAWRQIVLNLLDNATKYGGGKPRVVVRLENAADFARLTIDDEGPGVDLADRERIWKKFWRGDAARAAGTTGTGIGLATVRDLVLLHGGSCFVDRNVPRGARFHVHLPMKGPVPLARRDA